MSNQTPPPGTPTSRLQQFFRAAPLYAIIDTAVGTHRTPAELVDSLLQGGVRVIQYRNKGQYGRKDFNECLSLAKQIRGAGGLFIVNDRADVAALSGADGVHLGQQDLPPAKARQLLGAGGIIGFSTHTREQAAQADRLPVDYLAIGPIFPTRTKRNPDPVVGLAMVSDIRKLTTKPLVAIGGITLDGAISVLQAGADAVAVISDLLRDANIEQRVREFLSARPRGGGQ